MFICHRIRHQLEILKFYSGPAPQSSCSVNTTIVFTGNLSGNSGGKRIGSKLRQTSRSIASTQKCAKSKLPVETYSSAIFTKLPYSNLLIQQKSRSRLQCSHCINGLLGRRSRIKKYWFQNVIDIAMRQWNRVPVRCCCFLALQVHVEVKAVLARVGLGQHRDQIIAPSTEHPALLAWESKLLRPFLRHRCSCIDLEPIARHPCIHNKISRIKIYFF